MMQKAFRHESVHKCIDIMVMRVGHMNGEIPGEPFLIMERGCKPTKPGEGIVYGEIRSSLLVETVRRSEAGWSGTYDDSSHRIGLSSRDGDTSRIGLGRYIELSAGG